MEISSYKGTMYTEPIFVSIGIFIDQDNLSGLRLWMQKRQEAGPLNGLWEFPGGKIKQLETPILALAREINEEVGVDLGAHPPAFLFKIFPFQYSDRKVNLYVYLLDAKPFLDQLKSEGRWFDLPFTTPSADFGLKGLIPAANEKIIEEVYFYFKKIAEDKKTGLIQVIWNQ